MTFYEAALRVLEREGKPLHVNAIIENALKDNLLSHVGKSPEEVMQSRLLAMARRRNDRKVVATAPMTYGLVEWGIPEDPAALTIVPEQPKEDEKPLRPRERHPIPSPDKVRIAGRGERMRKAARREEEREERGRRRKFPPLAEVAFEVLSQAGTSMAAVDIAAAARERDLVSEDLGAEALLHALREDNRRRSEAGRKPAFQFGPNGEVSVEPKAAGEAPSVELEAAFAYAIGMPLTEGRPQERGPGASRLIAQAAEHKRQMLRLVRRRLGDMDAAGFERAAMALLEAKGFREIKVAKRGKDGPLVMARRKDGLTDLRWVIQLLKGGAEIEREDIDDLRKDLAHFGAQLGIVLSPADVTRDARHDASAGGQVPVLLWCADALSDLYAEAKLGLLNLNVEVVDLDEAFFRQCREKGREEERARRAREEREKGQATVQAAMAAYAVPQGAAPAAPPAQAPAAAPSAPLPVPTEAERAALAAAIVTGPSPAEREAAEQRRREEEKLRAEAHEKIEAAELQARARRAPPPPA